MLYNSRDVALRGGFLSCLEYTVDDVATDGSAGSKDGCIAELFAKFLALF